MTLDILETNLIVLQISPPGGSVPMLLTYCCVNYVISTTVPPPGEKITPSPSSQFIFLSGLIHKSPLSSTSTCPCAKSMSYTVSIPGWPRTHLVTHNNARCGYYWQRQQVLCCLLSVVMVSVGIWAGFTVLFTFLCQRHVPKINFCSGIMFFFGVIILKVFSDWS